VRLSALYDSAQVGHGDEDSARAYFAKLATDEGRIDMETKLGRLMRARLLKWYDNHRRPHSGALRSAVSAEESPPDQSERERRYFLQIAWDGLAADDRLRANRSKSLISYPNRAHTHDSTWNARAASLDKTLTILVSATKAKKLSQLAGWDWHISPDVDAVPALRRRLEEAIVLLESP
jgi:hypothetical protein